MDGLTHKTIEDSYRSADVAFWEDNKQLRITPLTGGGYNLHLSHRDGRGIADLNLSPMFARCLAVYLVGRE